MNFGNRFLVAKFLFSGSTHTKQRGARVCARVGSRRWALAGHFPGKGFWKAMAVCYLVLAAIPLRMSVLLLQHFCGFDLSTKGAVA